jgi:hypothetical protein
MSTLPTRHSLENLVVLHFGSLKSKQEMLARPGTSDAIRIACKGNRSVDVRMWACHFATSDAVRLAFKDDPEERVRASAVDGAESDETRMAFASDTSSMVRQVVAAGLKSDELRLLFLGDGEYSVRMSAARHAIDDSTRIEFLKDKDTIVRAAAVEGMRSTTILEDALAHESDRLVQSTIQIRLYELSDQSVPGRSLNS